MTDIVERLRAETNGGGLLRWCAPQVANEAAAEIERLRAALRELAEAAEDYRYWVKHNPEFANDPCAEIYNLRLCVKEARALARRTLEPPA